PHPFNYSAQMNLGARAASGDLLLLMNNDATVTADGWLTEMAEQAMRPEVGQVGVRLSYPDGQAQHEGVVIGIGYVASNIQYGDAGLYRDCVRDVAAVTAACALLRRSVFDEVGGFDEQLSVAYNDRRTGLPMRVSPERRSVSPRKRQPWLASPRSQRGVVFTAMGTPQRAT
ncbi:MAG: glycosyltransferase, partial [Acidimicrobiales bacterium]